MNFAFHSRFGVGCSVLDVRLSSSKCEHRTSNIEHRILNRKRAFTLVELLVVIGIVTLLIALLMPALGKARRQSLQLKCLSNVRQIALGIIQYSNDHKGRMVMLHFTDDAQWAHQYNQLVRLRKYTPDWNVFHCSVADPKTPQSGDYDGYTYGGNPSPPFGAPAVPAGHIFRVTIDGIERYTDYKIADSFDVAWDGKKVNRFHSTWLVLAMDLDWVPVPRHNGGANLAFLDGHAEWKHQVEFQFPGPKSTDPYGNTPWYLWGRKNQ